MLSMKKILFVATLFLAAAVLGVTFFAGREQSSPRAATETPLTISPSPDLHGFLADKVADLANTFESPAEEPLPVKTGKEETADASGTAPIRRLPDREIIFRDDSGFRLINVSPKPEGVTVNGKPVDDVRLGDNDQIVIRNARMIFMRGTPVG